MKSISKVSFKEIKTKLLNNNIEIKSDIDEDEYLISVNFLIIESMVRVPDTSEPLISDIPIHVKKVAKAWTDGELRDFEYIKQLERLIERGIIS